MDLFDSMAVFVQVAEKGSMTAAAAAVGISPTMVGNHLRALELRLGLRLLQRTTRRQSLTEFGRSYYARCVDVLALVAEADGDALARQDVPRGRLRVSAPVSFGAEAVVPALGSYMRRHPEVEVDVSLSDRVVDLVEEGFEAAVRIGDLPDSGLIARALGPYRMMVCASPAYLAQHGAPERPADLARHRAVAFRQSAGSPWRFGEGDHAIKVEVPARLQVDNGQAIRAAACAGLGVVLQPEVLLAADVAAGRLIRLLPDHRLPSRPMHLVFHADRTMSAKLKSFVDFMVETFGPAAATRDRVTAANRALSKARTAPTGDHGLLATALRIAEAGTTPQSR